MGIKRIIIAVAVSLLCLSTVWAGGEGEQPSDESYTIRIAHSHGERGLYYIGSVRFEQIVEERSAGRIQVEHFPNGQLGSDRDIQEGIRLGTIEAGISSSPVVLLNDYYRLLDAPYLFTSREHVTRVLDGEIGQQMAMPLEESNIKHLGYWENGFRQITNNIRPINTPADLDGVKLRTPESPVRMMTFETYGASPVPMSFSEVFGSLQQGIIDGQENPLGVIYQASFSEVQDYLSLTGHVYSAAHLLMNKELFDSMPEDLQAILVEAGREVAQYTRERGAQYDQELVDQLREAGMQVNEANVRAFVEASQPVWQTIVADVPFDDAADILAEIADLGN